VGFIGQLLSRFRRAEPAAPPPPSAPVDATASRRRETKKTPGTDPDEERRQREIEALLQSFRRGIVDDRFLDLDVDRRFVEQFDQAIASGASDAALPPASAFDVMRMVDDPQFQVKKVSGAVACEPAIAGAVLTLANSPLHRGGQKVETLHEAVMRLGQKQLRLLLLEIALHTTRVKGRPFEQFSDMTWKHSLLAAQIAYTIAEAARLDPEHAYVAGLFHDVGVLAVLGVARQMALKGQRVVSKQTMLKLIAAHSEAFNARVMKKWNLPPAVAAAVVHRGKPEGAGEHAGLAAVTQLANDLCRQHGAWAPQHTVDFAEHPALATLKIGADRLPRRDEVIVMAFKVEKVAQLT
jgi:HD-like signal output (HDOD) protein